MVVSNFSQAQENLRRLGFDTSSLNPSQLHFGTGQLAFDRLLQGSYTLVWVDTPGVAHGTGPNKLRPFWTSMTRWATTARNMRVPLFICGPQSQVWMDARAKCLVSDGVLHHSKHRLCHFGLKFARNESRPSLSMFVMFSTVDMPTHECRCHNVGSSRSSHVRDWLLPETRVASVKAQVVSNLYKRLMATPGFRRVALCGPDYIRGRITSCLGVPGLSR